MSRKPEEKGQIKLPSHTQVSDYSVVHSNMYDLEFISQINKKMQVPDRISMADFIGKENDFVQQDLPSAAQFARMTVPDRIVLAVEDKQRKDNMDIIPSETEPGENELFPQYQDRSSPYHLVPDSDLQNSTDTSPAPAGGLTYIALTSPPRTLTYEERFPVVEDTDDHKMMAVHGGGPGTSHMTSNGHIVAKGVYNPSVSYNDPVLHTEESEIRLLRTQVVRLTRRVQIVEQDNQNRVNREFVMYPLILGYFLWKVLGWLTHS